MPESFTHRNADVYVPLARKLDPATRRSHFLTTFARLKPGVTLERATADMRALGQTLAKEFGHNHGIDVKSYYELIVGNIRGSLQVLLGAVTMVLLIACANVANLLLASGFARRRELGIRMALGAGRGDLARQLTCEGLLLALAGGVLGLVLAVGTVRASSRSRRTFCPERARFTWTAGSCCSRPASPSRSGFCAVCGRFCGCACRPSPPAFEKAMSALRVARRVSATASSSPRRHWPSRSSWAPA